MPKKYLAEDYYRAARELLPNMDDAMRQSVEDLLKQAEAGVKTDNRIVEIVTENELLRKQFRDALNLEGEITMGADFSPLAGNPASPNARKYICPVPGHDFIRRIQKAGDDPGMCPEHNVALIPVNEKGGK
jgi:hypothetical protein